jgi:preprotein translocase subunit SecY
MLNVFINSWKVKEIRKKLIYILLMLAVYRIGCRIALPGISVDMMMGPADQAQNIFSLITGGGVATIFAMGIGPYITSSIIMQLLTVAIPKLEQIQKEGEEGRKRINKYTRYVALVLAVLQAVGTVYSLDQSGMFVHAGNFFVLFTAVVALVTGTMFVVWISELLTEKGIGNGSSFIISANILASLPMAVDALRQEMTVKRDILPFGLVIVLLILIIFVAVIAFVVWIQDGERRIPVQYSKKMVGRQMYGGQSSFIPIKVNIAGVMSIIFSISLLQFPQTISQFFATPPAWLTTVVEWLQLTHPCGAILYVILIFCFTFFYTSFAINPIEMAENMKKNGGFVPGIRPGKPTTDYIQRTIDRLSWIGAIFYAIIAMIPVLIEWIFKIPAGFGGTTLLIVTGVALELVKQLESQLLMRHHKGFLS